MKVIKHLSVSLSLGGGLWDLSNSLYAGIICFIGGVFVDIDHIIEYILHYGYKNFTLRRFYKACAQTDRGEGRYQFKKLHFFFHSVEFAFLLAIIAFYTKNLYFFSLALGYSSHLILDYIGNPVYPYTYFFFWRAANKFYADRVLRRDFM